MEYRQLGKTDIKVSLLSLGTMTFGEQTPEDDAHAQMDYALDNGINLFDTAEMYSVPPKAETYGATEAIIGNWFEKSGKRKDVVLATKIAGPGMAWIRDGASRQNREQVETALAGSLQRLKTDYIDLYQIHWPVRPVNSFGKMGYDQYQVSSREADSIRETLEVLSEKVKAGVIRTIGLSNETPWGVMTWLNLSKELGLERIVSIQNPYNFLNRTFEIGLAEMALQKKVGLLAYAPLGAGVLTGKYLNGQMPKGSRQDIDARPSRYNKPRAAEAITAYLAVAEKHGIDPVHMAISFVKRQPFMTSAILGARTLDQLKTDMKASDVALSDAVIADINQVHAVTPNPCP